jgi:hypothetical protein
VKPAVGGSRLALARARARCGAGGRLRFGAPLRSERKREREKTRGEKGSGRGRIRTEVAHVCSPLEGGEREGGGEWIEGRGGRREVEGYECGGDSLIVQVRDAREVSLLSTLLPPLIWHECASVEWSRVAMGEVVGPGGRVNSARSRGRRAGRRRTVKLAEHVNWN